MLRKGIVLVVLATLVLLGNAGCALDTLLNWFGGLGSANALST